MLELLKLICNTIWFSHISSEIELKQFNIITTFTFFKFLRITLIKALEHEFFTKLAAHFKLEENGLTKGKRELT